MPQDAGIDPPEITTPDSSNDSGGGDNPAWGEFLGAIPESLHPIAKPFLEKWDTGVQQRFEKVQSEYSPYKRFLDEKIDPAQIDGSLQLWNLMQQDPRKIYDALQQNYGDEWGINGQGQSPSADDDDFEDDETAPPQFNLEDDPRFKQMQEQQGTIASFLAAQVEKEERAKIDAEIDSQFKAVNTKYGELGKEDVDFIVSVALQQNIDVTAAADKYFARVGAPGAQTKQPLPTVVPTGGGIPQQVVDPTQLDRKGTRDMVAAILAANHQQE